MSKLVKSLLLIFFAGMTMEVVTTDAEARAGRGRSGGRSSSFSRQTPPPQPQAAPNQFGTPSSGMNPGMNPAMKPAGNSFLRGMAGGIAGGFLGSMLFSSLGHAAGGTGGTGGGIGFLEVLLFAGLAYLAFRWWKSRQQAATAFDTMTRRHAAPEASVSLERFRSLAPSGITPAEAEDAFFKIQGAWTRRDLAPVDRLLGDEIRAEFSKDIAELKSSGRTNRLENVAIRQTSVTNSWEEHGAEHSAVRFTANLLDYAVDDATGKVLEGSDTEPVKFEEDWVFAKQDGQWRLVGIQQV